MLQADLHAKNIGAFDNNNGELVYNVNDFDESIIGDVQYDLYRMGISLLLIAENNNINNKYYKKIIHNFIKNYLKEIYRLKDGKLIKKFTRNNTINPLKYFLKKVDIDNKEAREKLISKFIKDEKFNYELDKIKELDNSLKEKIKKILLSNDQYLKTLKKKIKNIEIIDIAERLYAGTGSLGVKRLYVYAIIDSVKVILDIKKQNYPSA